MGKAFALACALAFAFVACGGEGSSDAQPSQATECMSLCNKENTCGSSIDCNTACGAIGSATVVAGCDSSVLLDDQSACASVSCSDLDACLNQASVKSGCGGH
jgi:hypothetical protein